MSTVERLPPYSEEAEKCLLGSLLIDPDILAETAINLRPEHFAREGNRLTYKAMLSLQGKKVAIDPITVIEELRLKNKLEDVGGEGAVIDMMTAVPTAINAPSYLKIVLDMAVRRSMITAASQYANLAYDEDLPIEEILSQGQQIIYTVGNDRATDNLKSYKQLGEEYIDFLFETRETGPITGIPTGFVDLDRILGGLQNDYIMVAARPSMGKSSFVKDIVVHAASHHNKNVYYQALELSARVNFIRALSSIASISLLKLRTGDLTEEEFLKAVEMTGKLSELPVWVDDSSKVSVADVWNRCFAFKARRPLDMVVIDYGNLLNESGKEYEKMTAVAVGLQGLNKELECPVVLVLQLNRSVEERQDKRPKMADLRGSGAFEQVADTLLMIYRDEYYYPDTTERPNIAEIKIEKNNNGPTGTVDLYWNERLASFRNLQRQPIILDESPAVQFQKAHYDAEQMGLNE